MSDVVPVSDRRSRYIAGAGQTVFDIGFPISSVSDVAVYIDDEPSEDFTVQLNASTITLLSGTTAGQIVVLEGDTAIRRQNDFPRLGNLDSLRLNFEFSTIVRILQEIGRNVSRGLRLSRSEDPDFDPVLPLAVGGRTLAFSSDGKSFGLGPSVEDLNNALPSAVASAASAELSYKWAENNEDVPVQSGQFSSKHHSLKSADAAGVAIAARDQAISAIAALPLKKMNGTAPPAVTDDASKGYAVGSEWYDITGKEKYICLAATLGAANWQKSTLTLDELVPLFASSAQGVKADTSLQISAIATKAQVELQSAGKILDGSNVQYNPGVAKAWVNFNGTGTVAIRDSHNVSSVTDNGVGDYTINFIVPFANASFVPVMSAGSDTTLSGVFVACGREHSAVPNLSSYRMVTVNAGSFADLSRVYFAAFGDQ